MDAAIRSNKKRKGLRRAAIAAIVVVLAGLLVFVGLLWRAGGELAAPAFRPVGMPPAELAAVDVSFPSTSGSRIPGWLSRGAAGQGAVLVLHGAIDQHTPIEEAKAVFAAAAEPKTLWIVDGAAHVDLYHFAPQAYEEKVGAFLAAHLR